VSVDLGASEARAVPFSHVSARAIEAVRLLMIDLLDLETLMKVIPSAWTTVPFAIRARMNEAAWLSVLKTAGSELPPRTRTIELTLRLSVWFHARRRSRDKTSIIPQTCDALEQMLMGAFSLYYRMPTPPKASDELTASVSPATGAVFALHRLLQRHA
jgi:hypothetical protein